MDAHYNHFHIDLRPPERVPVGGTKKLEAEGVVASDALASRILDMVPWDDVESELNLTQGEAKMFVLDTPDVSPQYAQVMIADATQAQRAANGKVKKMGVCHIVPMIEDAPPPRKRSGGLCH